MKKWTSILSTFILCYLLWILLLMQDFNILALGYQELIVGAVISLIVSYLTNNYLIKEDGLWIFKKNRILSLVIFIPVYIGELIKANWDVAIRALSPNIKIEPAIVKIETDISSDWGLSMLANCITLTPGTITMDIFQEDDRKIMYIHWIDGKTENTKEASEEIKGKLEPYVRRIFK